MFKSMQYTAIKVLAIIIALLEYMYHYKENRKGTGIVIFGFRPTPGNTHRQRMHIACLVYSTALCPVANLGRIQPPTHIHIHTGIYIHVHVDTYTCIYTHTMFIYTNVPSYTW